MIDDLTIDELEEKLIDICNRFPNNVNPMINSKTCAYTDPDDPTRHCLIGQFLVENAPELLPEPRSRQGAFQIFKPYFSYGIAQWANRYQAEADNEGLPRPWHEVKQIIEQLREQRKAVEYSAI